MGIGNSRRLREWRDLTRSIYLLAVSGSSFTFNTPPLGGAVRVWRDRLAPPAVVKVVFYFSGLDGKLYGLTRRPSSNRVNDMRHATHYTISR